MKIKYIGETIPLELTKNKIYNVISIEKEWYRIIIDEPIADDYLYPPQLFEVVEDDKKGSSTKSKYGKLSQNSPQTDFTNIAAAGK